jgi:copper chaperone CopZ
MTGTTRRATLKVADMTCTGCEQHIAAALERAGAEQVSADFRRGVAPLRLARGRGRGRAARRRHPGRVHARDAARRITRRPRRARHRGRGL